LKRSLTAFFWKFVNLCQQQPSFYQNEDPCNTDATTAYDTSALLLKIN
jgi:hypothetical protein